MKKVLIVDNSRLMRSILKELLTELDLEPIGEAVDVPEAIKAYHALQPDLVTLDLIMPGGSGLDVLKDIRTHNPKTNVLIITESGQESVDRLVHEAGANGILHKPVTREDLQRAIKALQSGSGDGNGRPGKPRALVVDDSIVMRNMVKELLAEQGVDTAGEAGDVVEAIKAYSVIKPDLVTLDLIMPGGSGFDVLKKIMSQDPKAKVMMVSSVAQEKVTDEALQLGACAVLHKPLTQEIVRSALSKVFPAARPAGKPEPARPKSFKDFSADQVKMLERIFRNGAETCLQAMDTMCKQTWKLSGIRFLDGTSPEVTALMKPSEGRQVIVVQMTVGRDIPTVCLLVMSHQGAEQITNLLTHNQREGMGPDVVQLVLMEWANILITAILNAFANSIGGAIVSTPPSVVDWPTQEVIARATRELSDLPERNVLVRVQYLCDPLKADCETLFIFRADSMNKLLGTIP